jgi:hypothetical protein
MRRAARWAALLLAALAACGGRDHAWPEHHGRKLSKEELQRIVTATAAARQLPPRRPVRIELVPRDRFVSLLLADGDEQDDDVDVAALLGFNLVPPPESRRDLSPTADVLVEQVVGFYHREQDRVFLPDVPLKTAEEEVKQRGILSHEVQHALQAQHFEIASLADLEGDDARLAYLAVLEGDAMVSMAAYFGAEYGAPIGRTLRSISDVKKRLPPDAVAQRDNELGRALPLTRELLIFPYDQGMEFVADLFRAGGFELVNRLYEQPPVSTSQVLHPERYLRGVLPAHIDLPAPAESDSEVTIGRLGELRTAIVLGQCLDAERARRAAAGWRGDAFRVTLRNDGSLTLAWLTVLDREEDAVELERALAQADACWHENRAGERGGPWIAAGARVKRKDDRVAVVRGVEPSRADDLLSALLDARVTYPMPEPVGDYTIPERRPLPEHRVGRIDGDTYESRWLGLVARLPAGMRYSLGDEGIELRIEKDQTSIGLLVVSDRITNPRFIDRTFAEFGERVRQDLGGITTTSGTIRIPLGEAIERTWVVPGSNVQLRAIMVPICAGTGSIVLFQAYADAYSKQVLDGWIESFRWRDGRNILACDRLDPK